MTSPPQIPSGCSIRAHSLLQILIKLLRNNLIFFRNNLDKFILIFISYPISLKPAYCRYALHAAATFSLPSGCRRFPPAFPTALFPYCSRLQISLHIQNIGCTTAHAGSKIASCTSQNNYRTTGHIFTAMVTNTLNNSVHAAITDAEAFTGSTADKYNIGAGLTTPAAIVPTPTSLTSLTLMRARGLAFFRS